MNAEQCIVQLRNGLGKCPDANAESLVDVMRAYGIISGARLHSLSGDLYSVLLEKKIRLLLYEKIVQELEEYAAIRDEAEKELANFARILEYGFELHQLATK